MKIDLVHGFQALAPSILLYLLGGGVGLLFLWRYRRRKTFDENIRHHGTRTTAHIVRLYKGILTRDLIYIYEYEGKLYGQLQHVSPQAFRRIHEGDAVGAYYLPDTPREAILAEIDVWYLDYRFAIALFSCIIISIILFVVIGLVAIILISFYT